MSTTESEAIGTPTAGAARGTMRGAETAFVGLEPGAVLPRVEVRDHPFGRGVYARTRIRRGELVLIGWGPYVERSVHSFQVGRDLHVRIANEIELINHSCDPNCGILLPLGATRLQVVAMRDIQAGEELTTDYAMHDYEIRFMPERCRCGSPICRGRITGYRDLPPERRAAYGRHVAAYLPLLEAERRGGGPDAGS